MILWILMLYLQYKLTKGKGTHWKTRGRLQQHLRRENKSRKTVKRKDWVEEEEMLVEGKNRGELMSCILILSPLTPTAEQPSTEGGNSRKMRRGNVWRSKLTFCGGPGTEHESCKG